MKDKNTTFRAVLLTLILCLMTILETGAQRARTYDVSSGLSTNSIKSIIQDRQGYIWFGSSDGLNVFNGKEFKSYGCSYHQGNDEKLNSINILTMLQHKDGSRIWVGTQSSSILLFDPKDETFTEYNLGKLSESLPTPNLCYSMAYDKEGQLWIGTDLGIHIYDETRNSFSGLNSQNSNLPSDLIQHVFCDSNGTMWIGSNQGLFKHSPSSGSFRKIKTDRKSFGNRTDIHISTITEGKSGNIWVGTWDKGLAIYDNNSNTLKSLQHASEASDFPKMRIRSILNDTEETLWLCTNIGLFRYDIITGRLSQIVLSTVLPNDNIYSSLKDSEGGIWIGTFFEGIYYFSPRSRQIACYTPLNVSGHLNGCAISSFCEDSDEKIYLASENGGLSLFDPEANEFVETKVKINGNMHALCIHEKTLFAGTYSQGLKIADLKTGHVRTVTKKDTPELQSNNIFSVFRTGDSNIYIGTDLGCTIYNTDDGSFKVVNQLSGSFIYDMDEDKSGNLWFACYYNGIFRYDRQSGEWKHYYHDSSASNPLPHDKTLSIYIDDNDGLWLCTEGGGIYRYSYETDEFSPLTLRYGNSQINLSIVYGILNDSEGNLWVSSNNGIWVCSTEGKVFRHLTHEDGLQSNQYNYGASFRSSAGRLYFGGVNGFNIISPEGIKDSGSKPYVTAKIVYEDKDGETVTSTKSAGSEKVILPRSVSSFSIDFECLSYIAPHKNEFAYKIDHQVEWTYTTESSVTLLNFPYGRHTIKVKARNGDGIWSRNEATLHINNLAPLMKSTGAKIIYILLLIGIIIAAIVISEKTPFEIVFKKQENEESQHNLETIEKNTRRLLNLVNQLVDEKEETTETVPHDQEWFSQLTRLIQENIQETEISVESIAAELNMSRSSFQRKLKALTGLSPLEFIRLTRLKKAAELLSTNKYRVNEVAYMVGFNKPSYFSAMFKKQYGVLPKDFINKN